MPRENKKSDRFFRALGGLFLTGLFLSIWIIWRFTYGPPHIIVNGAFFLIWLYMIKKLDNTIAQNNMQQTRNSHFDV